MYRLLFLLIVLSSCSFSKKQAEIKDAPKDHSHYEQNHSCSISAEELDKLTWVINKPYKKRTISNSKRAPSSVEDLNDLLGQGCDYLDNEEIEQLVRISDDLGYSLTSPMSFPKTIEGLQTYLDEVGGVYNFSAEEMVAPNHPSAARSCGLDYLLPINCRWASAATLGHLAQKFRDLINEEDPSVTRTIRLRNWYRPKCYNSHDLVRGSDKSDHRWSRAFDLDFASANDRAIAQKYLCQIYKDNPFNLSVGIGCRTLHVGIASHHGSRFWTYPDLAGCQLKRLDGDDCWRQTESGRRLIHTDQASTGAL
jgi:hypothetical protein